MKILITFILFGAFLTVLLVYSHESAHVKIYEMDGIESRVEYFSHFPNAVTIPEKNCKTEICTLANEQNEIVGYNTSPIFFLLFVGLIIIIGELGLSNYYKRIELRRNNEI